MKPSKYTIITIFTLLVFFQGCKKDDDNKSNNSQKPVISGIVPSSGPKGTLVTISGEGFSNQVAQVMVFFNDKPAQVIEAGMHSLKVLVPPKAGSGNIKVYVNGEAGSGPVFNFIYTITVTTFSGSGVAGFADGNAQNAMFNSPRGLAIDPFDNIYVADELNHAIRRIATNGNVTTFAGTGIAGFANGNPSSAQFDHPFDIVTDPVNSFFYVADRDNHVIRRLNFAGDVTTAAGIPSTPGYTDGPGLSARLNFPTGITLQGEDPFLYVADGGNHCIRVMDNLNIMSTLAGTNIAGQADGSGSAARFNTPFEITWDSTGSLYVSDIVSHNIRRITLQGQVSTVTGAGIAGYFDGPQLLARFDSPESIFTFNNELYICDHNNHRIRAVSSGGVTTTLTGNGQQGLNNGSGTSVSFNGPSGIVRNSNGDYFISETGNNVIRKMTVD